MNVDAGQARVWMLSMRRGAGLNVIVLTVTAAAVIAYVALFAAQA